jgi:hypothetical protein
MGHTRFLFSGRLLAVAVVAGSWTVSLTGCHVDLPPRPDEVELYLESLSTRGETRRLWPEGQAYVEGIVKAMQDLDETLEPILGLGLGGLKPLDKKMWKRHWRLQDRLDEIEEALEDPEKITEREEAWEAIFTAVENVPDSIAAGSEEKAAFAAKVYDIIGFNPTDALSDHVAGVCQRLDDFRELYEAAIAFHKDDNALAKATMESTWLRLSEELIEGAEKGIESKRETLAKHLAEKAELDVEKVALKESGDDPERLRTVMFLMHYHQTASKAAETSINKLNQLIKRNREAML